MPLLTPIFEALEWCQLTAMSLSLYYLPQDDMKIIILSVTFWCKQQMYSTSSWGIQ